MAMKESVVARRYARAFFLLALEEEKVDNLLLELQRLVVAVEKVPQLLHGLGDQQVKLGRRKLAATHIAETLKLSDFTTNLLHLTIDKGRVILLPEILTWYQRMEGERKRLASAKLVVASKIAADESVEQLRTILRRLLSRDVTCEVDVDPKIIGGFVVRVGDVVYDASVAGRLARMKEELLGTDTLS
ncbi:MAG: ATP synthase F1 subunit delta [Deltaproteobacteria bacterium]|nr:ATP synthase F1 subunit delta [Deltaproteobacteria bacterium]